MHRRDFLSSAASAGLVFTGCCLAPQTAAGQFNAYPVPKTSVPNPKRREVRVGGKRVRTIDVHAHVVVPEAAALLGARTVADDPSLMTAGAMSDLRLNVMNEWGTDMQALSINPTWYAAERDLATRVCQMQNEALAALCAKHPDRFVAFATVALQFPELAAQQLEDGVKKYGLRGAAIGGHVNNDELSNPKFDPFWRKAEELDCLVFTHPQGIPEIDKRVAGKGYLTNTIGNPLETTIALSHLIFDGTFDKFPRLKLCAAHAGGYLPSYKGRTDFACVRFPADCKDLKKKPTDYLRQIYFDSMVFSPEGLRHLVAEVGAGQVMIGTDYPFPWSTTTVNEVLATQGLSDADKRGILGETAAKLLRIA